MRHILEIQDEIRLNCAAFLRSNYGSATWSPPPTQFPSPSPSPSPAYSACLSRCPALKGDTKRGPGQKFFPCVPGRIGSFEVKGCEDGARMGAAEYLRACLLLFVGNYLKLVIWWCANPVELAGALSCDCGRRWSVHPLSGYGKDGLRPESTGVCVWPQG